MPDEIIWTKSLKDARAAYRANKSGEGPVVFQPKEYKEDQDEKQVTEELPEEKIAVDKVNKSAKADKNKKKEEK